MHRAPHVLVVAVLFASGALSLGYQMVWSTLLLDHIGVSAYSHAAVLASFMGGIALGSAWLGRLVDRVRRPVLLLAALELGIGLYAFAFPALLEAAAGVSTHWVAPTAGLASLLTRTLVAALLLLPPTLLMGGTYPAALRQLTADPSQVARHASRLYSGNAAGAVLGALATTFVLMPRLGVSQTLGALGAANLVLAAGAAALGLRLRVAGALDRTPLPAPLIEALLVCMAGFVSFSLEIAWIRFFGIVLASSVYSFAIIVAAFVAGIALGALLLGTRRHPPRSPLLLFAWTQAVLGLLLMLVLPLYTELPGLFAAYLDLFSTGQRAFSVYEIGKLLFCFSVVLPPTLLVGMSIPLLVQHVSRDVGHLGGDAGRIYAWNTWGNVLGALVAGLVLLPALGMERLIRLAALLAGLVGLAAAWRSPNSGLRSRSGVAGVVALSVALHLTLPAWDPALLTLVPFRRGRSADWSGLAADLETREVLYFRDDAAAHLAVVRRPGATGPSTALLVNGKPDASSVTDMPTQILLGQLPLLLHPAPERVLVVGLASGVTVGATLTHDVERVDAVEIVRSMPEATAFFDAWNGRPLEDSRLRLIFEDAKRLVATSTERYDVILSAPPNPWVAGVSSLFSEEFYRDAQQRLAPGGVFAQWVQAYEMSDETFAVVVRTLRERFPNLYGFQGSNYDVLFVATHEPLRPDWDRLAERLRTPAVARQLGSLGITDVGALLWLQRFSPATLDALAAKAPFTNTLDNRFLEQRGPRELFQGAQPRLVAQLDERLQASPALFWSEYVHGRHDVPAPLVRDPRLRGAALQSAVEIAALQLDPGLLSAPPAAALFPAALLATPPPSPIELAGRVLALVDAGQPGAVEALLERYRPALLIESALDAPLGRFWLERSALWSAPPRPANQRLRQFRIELMMATRQLAAAGEELERWAGEPTRPSPAWGVRVACLVDRERLCEAIRARLSPRPRDASRSGERN